MDATRNKKIFVILWILSILGTLAVFPYVFHLETLPATVSISKIILLGTIQSALLFGLVCWLSYKVLPKTDLNPFPPLFDRQCLKTTIYPALIAGFLVGLTIFFSDRYIFNDSLLSGRHPPIWTGLLASIYGGINEEVLLRLFLFSCFYFLVGKCIKIKKGNRSTILWCVNIFVALLFGLGHLPAALHLVTPSFFEVSRILLLNGIAGVVFGWLYWNRGLWTAMAAHFVTDLIIHAFLI